MTNCNAALFCLVSAIASNSGICNGQHALRLAPPHTGSPGPFGPGALEESEKSPERSSTLGQGPKSPKRVRPGVSKESEKSLKPDFWTLFGLF